MLRPLLLLGATLCYANASSAQQLERELGDFDFKLSTTASRSMAQGLVAPSAVGTFHGGLDVSHSSGWYGGQYAPSMGLTPNSVLRLDHYMGYKGDVRDGLGLEAGVIHYSQPRLTDADSYAVYGGLSVLGSRLGGAWRNDPDNRTATLYADFGRLPLLRAAMTLKVAHHSLGTPFTVGDGGKVDAFTDWALQLSRPWRGLDLNLIYSNSNLSGNGCGAYAGINAYCEGMLTFKAQRTFF